MKKIINRIQDTSYIIPMVCILLIMFVFPTPLSSDEEKLYILRPLFLLFTIIAVLYFYIKDNHSQKVISILTTQEDEISIIISQKFIIIIFFMIICFRYSLYDNIPLLFPMFLYLNVRYTYKSNKLLQSINNIYKILHILFLLYFNIYVFSSDFANSLKIPTGVVYSVIILSSIYTIILSYFIGKKTMFLYLFLSIMPVLIVYMTWNELLISSFILIFLINYIFIYYKQYLFAFIFLVYAILHGKYLLPIIVISLVISLIFSDDKHNTPSISKTIGKDEQD